jgi:carboxypeptidase D
MEQRSEERVIYKPYISKALFSTPNPPVRLAKIAIGNGALGSFATFLHVPVVG